jgi:hypothetical protein
MFTLLIRNKSVAWKGLMMDILIPDDGISLDYWMFRSAFYSTKLTVSEIDLLVLEVTSG